MRLSLYDDALVDFGKDFVSRNINVPGIRERISLEVLKPKSVLSRPEDRSGFSST
jgi:hypothetical protein